MMVVMFFTLLLSAIFALREKINCHNTFRGYHFSNDGECGNRNLLSSQQSLCCSEALRKQAKSATALQRTLLLEQAT